LVKSTGADILIANRVLYYNNIREQTESN